MENNFKIVKVYCTSQQYNMEGLSLYFTARYKSQIIKDVIHLEPNIDSDVYIFSYGVTIFWNTSYDQLMFILKEISDYEINPLEKFIIEDFNYSCDKDEQAFKVKHDKILLTENTFLEKLAISHGIAQSIKLNFFEETIMMTIKRNQNIPEELEKTGKIRLNKKEISMERGRLFKERSQIYLDYGLLDTPEFFWEYPELEPLYNITANYLDIKPRIEVLNKKLEVIQDLLNVLADEQKHKHSSFLEIIIIVLIAFEIILTIFTDIFKIILNLFN